jgi:hypothetical protein
MQSGWEVAFSFEPPSPRSPSQSRPAILALKGLVVKVKDFAARTNHVLPSEGSVLRVGANPVLWRGEKTLSPSYKSPGRGFGSNGNPRSSPQKNLTSADSREQSWWSVLTRGELWIADNSCSEPAHWDWSQTSISTIHSLLKLVPQSWAGAVSPTANGLACAGRSRHVAI